MLLDDAEPLKLQQVREYFESRVVGQPAAVNAVVDLIALIKSGLNDPDKPLGVYLFAGPTGVGKTEMAKTLAKFIFGSADRMIRCDMSEFKDYDSYEKLIGFHRAGEETLAAAGNLLGHVRQQPFSVILFDEIEKAHSNVFDLLLQMFDDARLTDSGGRTTHFNQTIIIMTSNLGTENAEGAAFGFGPEGVSSEDAIEESVRQYFRPELVNRIDRILTFRPLSREHVRQIARRELGQVLMRQGITRRMLRVDVDRGVVDILADAGFSPTYGVRPLKRAVERIVLLPIARALAEMGDDDRPALLRLLPKGDDVELKLVYDRPARRSESIARGLKVVDPVAGVSETLKPTQIRQRVGELRDRVKTLEQLCEENSLRDQQSHLITRTGQVDFWDDPDGAREVMGDLYRLTRILEAVESIGHRASTLTEQLEVAISNDDRRELRTVAEGALATERHADVLRFSILCRDRLDRCDAFVAITAIDEAEEDLAGHLADMYSGWARRKGFQVRVAHEELFTPKLTKEVVLLIEGVAIYGLLRHEHGMHEFVFGKTADSPKRSVFTKVSVLAVVDTPDAGTKIATDTSSTRGSGLRCQRYRSRAAATHPATGCHVEIQSELEPSEASELAGELLRAELLRLEMARSSTSSHPEDRPVRRYNLHPRQSAIDLSTNVEVRNLKELWKGDLDEFLTASLRLRDAQDVTNQ